MRKPFISLSFGFSKMFWKLLYLCLGTKKNHVLFLQVFRFSQFSLEIPSTHLTMHCHKCLFHMNNHINQVVSGMIVERTSRPICTSKNIEKKSTWVFLVSGRRF